MLFRRSQVLLCGLVLLGQSSLLYAQDFYKWVDAHGSTHYTTTPPPKSKVIHQKGKVQTYGFNNSNPTHPQAVNTQNTATNLTAPVAYAQPASTPSASTSPATRNVESATSTK